MVPNHFEKYGEFFRIFSMDINRIQKITDKEYDGDLDTYENKVKLYKRLDKELEGTDRVFLKILKNDIKELKPIDDFTEYLVKNMEEYDKQNNIEA